MATSGRTNQATPINASMSHIIPPDNPPKLPQDSQTSNSPNSQTTAEVITAQVVGDSTPSQNIGNNDSTGVLKRPPMSSPKPSSPLPFIPPLIPNNPSKKIRQQIPDKLRITKLGQKRSVLPENILRETDSIQQMDGHIMSPLDSPKDLGQVPEVKEELIKHALDLRMYEECHDRMSTLINMSSLDRHQRLELSYLKNQLKILMKKLGGLEKVWKSNFKKLTNLYPFPD